MVFQVYERKLKKLKRPDIFANEILKIWYTKIMYVNYFFWVGSQENPTDKT